MSTYNAGYRVGPYSAGYRVGPYNASGTASRLPPGATPFLWFSAQDINLLGNAGIADGASLATWKNKGTAGSAWDMVQATGANQPTFKQIGGAGKLNGLSSVHGDGVNGFMASAVVTTQAQPATWLIVAGNSTWAGTQVLVSGSNTNRNQLYISTTFILYSGGAVVSSLAPTSGKWQAFYGLFNGAASLPAMDGVSGAVGNASTAAFDQVAVFSGPPHPSSLFAGDIVEVLCWTGSGQPSVAQTQAWVAMIYGGTPQ